MKGSIEGKNWEGLLSEKGHWEGSPVGVEWGRQPSGKKLGRYVSGKALRKAAQWEETGKGRSVGRD